MNKDIRLRDEILFGAYDKNRYCSGGISHFECLSLEKLRKLMEDDYIDPEGCQNESPTAQEIYEYMCGHPNATAIGYAVDIRRPDYRITLEGVNDTISKDDTDRLIEFINLFRWADEQSIVKDDDEIKLYAWYD